MKTTRQTITGAANDEVMDKDADVTLAEEDVAVVEDANKPVVTENDIIARHTDIVLIILVIV